MPKSVGLGIVGGTLALLLVFAASGCNREESDWEKAAQADTIEGWRQFLGQHPEGKRRAEANRLLAELIEQRDWRDAHALATVESYEAYVAAHPDSPRTGTARAEIRRMLEADHWARVRAQPSVHGVRVFLDVYPDGSRSADARALLARLEEERAWAEATRIPSIAGYETYLRANPGGSHAGEAARRLAGLIEARDWNQALAQDTIESFTGFLARHPESAHAPEAGRRLSDLRVRNDWSAAKAANTREAYERFLFDRGHEWSVPDETRKEVLEGLVQIHRPGEEKADETTTLHLAVLARSPALARRALADGLDIDARDGETLTALHLAARRGDDAMAAFLIDHGASLERATAFGWTALGLARKDDHAKTVALLKSRGAKEVDPPPEGQPTLLQIHIAKRKVRIASEDYSPNYAKYENIVHLSCTQPIGKSSDSEQTIVAGGRKHTYTRKGGYSIYLVLITGTDPRSGRGRGFSPEFDLKVIFGIKPDPNQKPSCGKAGSRITFLGDRDAPFEPFPGLKLWQGSVDIDPEHGLVILPGTGYEYSGGAVKPITARSKAAVVDDPLRGVDWEIVSESLARLPSLMDGLITATSKGGDVSGSLAGIQRWNTPLVAEMLKLSKKDVSGTGVNGKFCHPSVVARFLPATLEKMGKALSKEQRDTLHEIARRYAEEERNRCAAEREEDYRLQRLLDENALRVRFFDEIYKMLSDAQLDALRPPATRGDIRADLLSPAFQWVAFVRPMPLESREQLANRMTGQLSVRFGLEGSRKDALQELTADWGARIPASLFRAGIRLAGPKLERVRACAKWQLILYRTMVHNLDLPPEVAAKIRDDLLVTVPYVKGSKR